MSVESASSRLMLMTAPVRRWHSRQWHMEMRDPELLDHAEMTSPSSMEPSPHQKYDGRTE
jgi:hypothetical protein